MTKLNLNQDATPESIGNHALDNAISSPCDAPQSARERFLAQHGPAAPLRRPTVSKELRKAILVAEMARWERF